MWTTKISSISQGGVRQRGALDKGFYGIYLNIRIEPEYLKSEIYAPSLLKFRNIMKIWLFKNLGLKMVS